jgi:hypothetical protein
VILKIDLQYFPTIISSSALFNSTSVEFALYDPWRKMSFRNRCIVAGANGAQSLTVPVLGGRGQRLSYREVRIDHRGNWQKKHWRTIFSAFGRAPFFEHYAPGLEALFGQRVEKLVDWNLVVLDWLAGALRLPLPRQVIPGTVAPGIDLADRIRPNNYADPGVGIPSPIYAQVFQDRLGFLPNLSTLDLLLCVGPNEAAAILTGNAAR